MSKQRMNLYLGVSSLFTGFLLYVLFRQNTYIAKTFAYILPLDNLSLSYGKTNLDFLKYYLPDFLWAFSLSCLLQAFCAHSLKESAIYCCVAAACGVIWELLQWTGVLTGTGDWLDIIMYLTGSILCLLINLKERKT